MIDGGIIGPIVTGLGGTVAGIGGSVLWFRWWRNKIDKKVENGQTTQHKLELETKLAAQRNELRIDFLEKNLQSQHKLTSEDIGNIKCSLDQIWKVLKANEQIIVPDRLSDRVDRR